MGNDNFPTHFDGQSVNPNAVPPGRLPFKIEYGTCCFIIGEQEVVVINASEHDGDKPLELREPLSAYQYIRHWVVGGQAEKVKSRGWLRKLIGRKPAEIESGKSFLVVALVHRDEPWMTIILHAREIDRQENFAGLNDFKSAFGDLLGISIYSD